MMTTVPASEGMLGVLNALGIETVEIGEQTYGVWGPFAINTSSALSAAYFTNNEHTAIQSGLRGGVNTEAKEYCYYKANAELVIILVRHGSGAIASLLLAKTKSGKYIAMLSSSIRSAYLGYFYQNGATWVSGVLDSSSTEAFKAPLASNINGAAVIAFPFIVTQTNSEAVLGDMVCDESGECLLYFINPACTVPYDEVFTINGASFIRATSFMLLRLT